MLAMLLVLSVANLVTKVVATVPWDGGIYRHGPDGVFLVRGEADLADVPPGARLASIEGRDVEGPSDIARALDAHRVGDRLAYRFVTGSAATTPDSIRVTVLATRQRLGSYAPLFALALTLWLLAAVTALRQPVPAGFVPLTASLFGILAFSPTGSGSAIDNTFFAIDALGRTTLGGSVLLVALALGTPRPPRLAVRAGLVLGVPALVALAFATLALAGARIDALVASADRQALLASSVLIVVATAHLARQVAQARVPADLRDRMRWGLVALLFGALPFAATALIPIAVAGVPELVPVSGAAFLLVIPPALARALDLKSRRQARAALVRGVSGVVASGLLGALAAGVYLLLASRLPEPHYLALFLVGSALLGSVPATRVAHDLLRRKLLGSRSALRDSLGAFGQELLPLRAPAAIADRAAMRLAETFGVEAVEVARDGALLGRSGEPLETASCVEDASSAGLRVERLVFPVARPGLRITHASSQGALTLVLGPSLDGEELDDEDVALLTTFAHILFRAAENALLFAALHVRAEENARLYHENRQVIESSAVGMLLVTDDARVRDANRRLLEMLHTTRERIEGALLSSVLPAGVLDVVGGARNATAPASTSAVRVRIQVDGHPRVLDVGQSPLPGGGRLLTLQDVTLASTLEAAQHERERLAEIGMMTAQVAHEVATPLTGVSSFAQMLEERLDDPALREMARKIQLQAGRAAEIARGVLRRARPEEVASSDVELEPVDVAAMLTELVELLAPHFREAGATLELEVSADLSGRHVLRRARGRLEQVIVNLLLNAKDASPAGGVVTLAAEPEDELLLIHVTDRGPGIDEEHLRRIFDPFFTTKESGTGLGLFVARRLAVELGGGLEARSVPGQGTTMTARLPVAPGGKLS